MAVEPPSTKTPLMRKSILFVLVFIPLIHSNLLAQSGNGTIKKSLVLFTQPSGESELNYDKFKADGLFWGFMPNQNIDSDPVINNWANQVANTRSKGRYYFGRGEYDWGWKWMVDFMGSDIDD